MTDLRSLTEEQVERMLPPDPFGPTPLMLLPEMLTHRVIQDMVPDELVSEVMSRLELNHPSPEVMKREAEAAVVRAMRIHPLRAYLDIMTFTTVNVIRESMIVRHGEEAEDNPLYFPENLFPIVKMALVAAVSQMADMGLLAKVEITKDEE